MGKVDFVDTIYGIDVPFDKSLLKGFAGDRIFPTDTPTSLAAVYAIERITAFIHEHSCPNIAAAATGS